MSKKYNTKKKWLEQIIDYAWKGLFTKATNLINRGKYDRNLNYELTKNDATRILSSCSIDLRYSFIKPLILLGGKVPKETLKMVKEILNNKRMKSTFFNLPDVRRALEYVDSLYK